MQIKFKAEGAEVLLKLLMNDLTSENLIGIARVPEIRPGQKYRDLVRKIYQEAGIATAIVRLEFENGLIKIYVFKFEVDMENLKEDFYNANGFVYGYVVMKSDKDFIVERYKPTPYDGLKSIFNLIEKTGDLYREAEEKVRIRRAVRGIDVKYEWP